MKALTKKANPAATAPVPAASAPADPVAPKKATSALAKKAPPPAKPVASPSAPAKPAALESPSKKQKARPVTVFSYGDATPAPDPIMAPPPPPVQAAVVQQQPLSPAAEPAEAVPAPTPTIIVKPPQKRSAVTKTKPTKKKQAAAAIGADGEPALEAFGSRMKKKRTTLSARADLVFPVARIHRAIRKGKFMRRCGKGAAVYLAGVLQYLTAEVLQIAGEAAIANRKMRINPRFINVAVRVDEDFNKLLRGVHIADGGVLPCINEALIPKHMLDKMREKQKAEIAMHQGVIQQQHIVQAASGMLTVDAGSKKKGKSHAKRTHEETETADAPATEEAQDDSVVQQQEEEEQQA